MAQQSGHSEQPNEENAQLAGRWSHGEHHLFLNALLMHGKNWKLIEDQVGGRTAAQVRSHAQKFFLKISKIQKERKRNKRKDITLPSKEDQQVLQQLSQIGITDNTPPQIVAFLKRESFKTPPNPKARQLQNPPQNSNATYLNNAFWPSVQSSILADHQSSQDESFFVHLIKTNMQQFVSGKLFEIPPCERENEQKFDEEETGNRRKVSFSLCGDQEDEEKYNQARRKINN